MAHKAVEMKRSERSDAEIQLSKQVVQTFPKENSNLVVGSTALLIATPAAKIKLETNRDLRKIIAPLLERLFSIHSPLKKSTSQRSIFMPFPCDEGCQLLREMYSDAVCRILSEMCSDPIS